MAEPKSIQVGDRSGIVVSYVKSKREIALYGWYDTFVGIEGARMPLGRFLSQLGITEADVRRELRRQSD